MPEQDDMAAWMQDYNDDKEKIYGIEDHRLVLLNSPQYPGLVEDWVKGGESGLDNWTFCELISLARKRNFIFIGSIISIIRLTRNHFLLQDVSFWMIRDSGLIGSLTGIKI
jgi:hypothetical protein